MQTFSERAKEMDYSTLYYPYSEKGPKKVRRIENFLLTSIILATLGCANLFGAAMIEEPKPVDPDVSQVQDATQASQPETPQSQLEGAVQNSNGTTADNALQEVLFKVLNPGENSTPIFSGTKGFNWQTPTKTTVKFIGWGLISTAIAFAVINVFLVLNYLVNVIKRNREFERNVIINDIKAVSLYRKLMSALKIKKRLGEAKRAARPKSSGGESQAPSADNLSKVEELKQMRKMDVRINTRQKLATKDRISTIYTIFMSLPLDEMTASNLLKRVEKLDETTTRVARGKVTMGQYQLTEDRQQLFFQGETPDIPDPYNYTERLANKVDDNTVVETYESAYDIHNLVDRQATIDEKKEQAEEWAQRTGAMLDRYLITANMQVTRLGTNVSSSKATYTYDLALDAKMSSGFNKFDEAIDKAFKLKGSSVSLAGGHLEIILPIPKEYHIPINVPTLYREAFGEGVA